MDKDVMIGFPVYAGNLQPETMKEVIFAQQDKTCCVGGVSMLQGDSLVTRARNKIAREFLASDKNYLMFVDSDIIFTRAQINKLRKSNKDIIGGVYLKKKLPYAPVANGQIRTEGDLMVMREIGTGFMMIHRRVFERMIEAYPEIEYRPDSDEEKGVYHDFFRVGKFNGEKVNSNGRYLSEDYFFCMVARELGFNIYYDPSVLVGHAGGGIYPYPDNDLLLSVLNLLEMWNPERPYPMDILIALHKHLNEVISESLANSV